MNDCWLWSSQIDRTIYEYFNSYKAIYRDKFNLILRQGKNARKPPQYHIIRESLPNNQWLAKRDEYGEMQDLWKTIKDD